MNIQTMPISHGIREADALTDLWNASACNAHGFYPLGRDIFIQRVLTAKRYDPERLLVAQADGRIVGIAHSDIVREPFYEPLASVEALLVHPDYRHRGIGTALLTASLESLRHSRVPGVDALGCWPYSSFYCTLIDGSERSGIFSDDTAMLKLFHRAGFSPHRESIVMRLDLTEEAPREIRSDNGRFIIRKRSPGETWLDYVFRGWDLYDHQYVSTDGMLLSRAIFASMLGLNQHTGRKHFALFGVNTPEGLRGRGYARTNLSVLLNQIAGEGAETVELHVYADNTPALRLYTGLGFRELKRTWAMRKYF